MRRKIQSMTAEKDELHGTIPGTINPSEAPHMPNTKENHRFRIFGLGSRSTHGRDENSIQNFRLKS
jgi:hypothetical protein